MPPIRKQVRKEFRVEVTAGESCWTLMPGISQDAFLRVAKLHMADILGGWQLATVEQKHRLQNLLFEDGLFQEKTTSLES